MSNFKRFFDFDSRSPPGQSRNRHAVSWWRSAPGRHLDSGKVHSEVEGISQKNFDTIGQEPTPACLAHPETIAKVHRPRFNSAVKTEHSEDGGLARPGAALPK